MTVSRDGFRAQPRFLGNDGRKFFTLQFVPRGASKAHIVYVPPFGEEMNRCRALAAAQARRFAASGYTCALMDFHGTGDSEGELSDTSLGIWKDNIAQTIEALVAEVDVPIILWGFRLGAFIAMDFAASAKRPVHALVLWQPVTSGERYVTQFLRQRVASLAGKNLPPETTTEIRARLAAGGQVEVSGYTVGGALVADIENLSLERLPRLCSDTIHWLENISEPDATPGPAAMKAVELLRSQGNHVQVHTFVGPQVWQLHKRDEVPELIDVTSGLLP